jgi:hypothetical protein
MTNWISAPELDEFTDYWYDTANANTGDWYCIINIHSSPTSAITQVDHASTSYRPTPTGKLSGNLNSTIVLPIMSLTQLKAKVS